jgi:WD40 repeat protein
VAYEDGALKIWSPRERRCAEDAVTHAGRRGVKALRWSADGNETPRNFLLASGDATGLVAFWTVDRRARPEKIAELSPERALSFGEFLSAKAAGESGAFRVTHLLAAPFDAKTDADGEKNAPGSNLSSFRFLVGYARFGTGGSAMCAVDIRHVPHPDTEIVPEGPKSLRPKPITVASAVLFQSEAPFAAALLRRSRGTDSESMPATFAAVTLDLNSTLRCHAPPSPDWRAEDYQTKSKSKSKGVQSKEGCWTETLAFKLPVEGVTSEGLVWAREGVLAAVSDKDPSGAVRMFDLESGANYSLRAWDSEHVSGGDKTRLVTSQDSSRDFASRRLTCVARDDATGGLAVGSRDGRVAVFRRVGGFDEDERRRTGTTRDTDKQTTKSSDASRRAGSSRRSRRRGDDGRGDVGRVGGDVG